MTVEERNRLDDQLSSMQSTVFTSDHQLRSIQVTPSHFTDVFEVWRLTWWISMAAVSEYCALLTRTCCTAVSVIVRHLDS